MSRATFTALTLVLGLGLAQTASAQRSGGRHDDDNKPANLDIATIYLQSGRAYENVKVGKLDFAEIQYRERGRRPETLKGQDVAEIRWLHAPGSYNTGLSQLRAGLYDRAVQSFTAARDGAEDGSWLKVYGSYYLGETYRLMGTSEALDNAVKELKAVSDANPDHFMAPAAIYSLGLALASSGHGGEAVSTFGKLEKFGDLWRLRGKVGEGNAYLDQKDAGKARQAFEIANQSAGSFPSVRREAQVGIGKAYVMDKRYDDAIRFFDEIIAQPGVENEVAGGAWLGKGDCRYEQAQGSGDNANTLKEALLAYQTCTVRYAGVPGVYPKALYQASVIYKRLNMPKLAQRMAEELKSRCPSSKWAARLKE